MLLMYSIYWCSQLCYVNCWPTTCELMTWWCCIVRHHHVLLTYLTYGCRDALFAFISVFVTVTLLLLGDISYKWFRRMRSMLPFHGLFVCLSSLCIVGKQQKISTQFLLHMTAPCLSQIVLKFGLRRSTPSSSDFKFCPKVTYPLLFEHRRRVRSKTQKTAKVGERRRKTANFVVIMKI